MNMKIYFFQMSFPHLENIKLSRVNPQLVYSKWNDTVKPAITIETILINLIRMFKDGPDVSLNGSPTVSPTTVAL